MTTPRDEPISEARDALAYYRNVGTHAAARLADALRSTEATLRESREREGKLRETFRAERAKHTMAEDEEWHRYCLLCQAHIGGAWPCEAVTLLDRLADALSEGK